MVLRNGLPPGTTIVSTMSGHKLLIAVDPQFIIQRDPDGDRAATPGLQHGVTITSYLDIAIPGYVTDVEVAGIEVRCRQRLQVRFFFLEVGRRRLPELAQFTLVRGLGKPLLQQQVNVREAVELRVTDEEVVLEVFDHAFNLAPGSRSAGATSPGLEVIVLRQLQEAGVKHHIAVVIFQHGCFLIVDQHGFHAAAEVTEGPHQGLVGVLRILARRRKGVEATRVTQRVHGEVDFAAFTGHLRFDFSPVMLQLVTWLGFEAHGLFTLTCSPLINTARYRLWSAALKRYDPIS